MNADDEASVMKKHEKSPTENHSVTLDNTDIRKTEKGNGEDPKPRIVLTIRSEKSSAKSNNMKIVSTEEKHEEFSPRRSSRTRGKWEWICDSDASVSPKKDKSTSETEEAALHKNRSTSRRRKESDNVLANAIARKEKIYDKIGDPPPRSTRLQKPVKVSEDTNTQVDKADKGVRTRRSVRPVVTETDSKKSKDEVDVEVVEIDTDEDSQNQNRVMKLKHLCELGLKAINSEDDDAESRELEEETEDFEDDDEIDDDSEVISKLLEADEESEEFGTDGDEVSDEDFQCSAETAPSEQPRRSRRLCSTYMNESDHSSTLPDEEQITHHPRSSRRKLAHKSSDVTDRSDRPKRKRIRSTGVDDAPSEAENEDDIQTAGGDEGSEAACPVDETAVVATCYCETPSNVYAAPDELTEPVFCQAIEMAEGVRVGCSHAARKAPGGAHAPLLRAGPRAPYFMACVLHAQQLTSHMCCPACGIFCTQGIFYQCSEGHLFHLDCGLPYSDTKQRPGCPHCGVFSYKWQPANRECYKVQLEMKCSNKRIFLPDQREQCTPAYLGFSTLSPAQLEHTPVIPEDLLPSPPVDLKQLCESKNLGDEDPETSLQRLCDAIVAGETVQQLIPKIVSSAVINKPLPSHSGGTCVHVAAKQGHLGAAYLLQYAGADLDAVDSNMRTPLLVAVLALLDRPDMNTKEKHRDNHKESADDMEVDPEKETEKADGTEDETSEKTDSEASRPKDEDLMKVIRYLVAAGCDVNIPDVEGTTPLHIAAQYGSMPVCSVVLSPCGAAADPRDTGGWSPLVWAAENNYSDVVRLLLSLGADASSTDNEGNSAVHWCALAGAARALEALLHHSPAVLAAANAHSDTPLHIAARQGHYACVVVLLARGARTDIENSAGELPVELCTGQCQSVISLNMQMTIAVKDKFAKRKLLSSDISNGREEHPIPCVSETDAASAPDDFTYVTQHVTPQHISLDTTIQSMQGCDCKEGECSSSACSCVVLSVRRWFARGRLHPSFPYHDPPMLFECNQTCACNAKKCTNNVISRLSRSAATFVRTEVFACAGARGWGLRARAHVPRGAPVAAYCGELLAVADADTRPRDQYMFALDVKPDLLEQCADKRQLCVDAAQYGSAARFVNHSCRPNLAPVRVFTAARDLRLPVVALFATADVRPGDELTFDYGDKFWSVKSKWMKCECGDTECRYPVKSTEDTET